MAKRTVSGPIPAALLWSVVVLCALPLHAAEPEPGEDPPPRSWGEVAVRYQTECPSPLFTLPAPETLKAGPHTFTVSGSSMVRNGGPWQGALNIGVLGAVKEASPETRANLVKAREEFIRRGVSVVLSNGDISEGEDDLEDAFRMVAQEMPFVVFTHIGNSEGRGSFNRAYGRAAKDHPNLVNMNWVRHVDLGGIHLVSLPGYYNQKFLHGTAGCHYREVHVQQLQKLVDGLRGKGPVVLSAHGPPKSFGRDAIDVTPDAGNVGDPLMAQLIEDADIRFGIFGHILEAGGRGSVDLKTGRAVRWPMKKPVERLYINAGSASAMPWAMLNGKASFGMAAVYSLQGGKARAEFITLRK